MVDEFRVCSPLTAELISTKLHVTTTCDSCLSSSLKEESNTILSLPVHADVQTALNSVTLTESLVDGEQWYCPLCGELRDSTRETEIKQASDILIIHLKRYNNNNNSGTVLKDTSVVSCVGDHLDVLTIPLSLDDSVSFSNNYSLVATINHSGTFANGGHYWAYILKDTQWLLCNDSMVSKVNRTVLNNGTSYILFYRRC